MASFLPTEGSQLLGPLRRGPSQIVIPHAAGPGALRSLMKEPAVLSLGGKAVQIVVVVKVYVTNRKSQC